MRYIWIGIDADEQLRRIGERARKLKKRFMTADAGLALPLHISLKMSFPVEEDQAETVVNDIETYLRDQTPFEIAVKGYEYHSVIAWIRMENNAALDRIHDDLNGMLLEKYGVGLHEYDLDYAFHTTLFMENDTERVEECYKAIVDEPLPKTLSVDRFLIGCSDSGEPGSYVIVKEIEL